MTQQQKKSTAPSATDGKQLTGNQAAKFAAEDARNVLAQTEIKPPTKEDRVASIRDHIKAGSPHDEQAEWFLNIKNDSKYGMDALMKLIERGKIDEKTLQWVNKGHGMNGMICFCLVPDCGIGHFIPIRISVDT